VPGKDAIEFVSDLALLHFDVLAVQESGSVSDLTLHHANAVVIAADGRKSPSLILSSKVCNHIAETAVHTRFAICILTIENQNFGLVSAYLPDCMKSLDIFADAVKDLDGAMTILSNKYKHIRWMIGGDLNVEIPQDNISVGPHTSGYEHHDRSHIVLAWAVSWDLSFISTWVCNTVSSWTHEHYAWKTRSTLDYVLCSGPLAHHTNDLERMYGLDWSTDHIAIRARFSIPLDVVRPKHRRRHKGEINKDMWLRYWTNTDLLDDIGLCTQTMQTAISSSSEPRKVTVRAPPIELRNAFSALASSESDVDTRDMARVCHKLERTWVDEVRAEKFIKNSLSAPRIDKNNLQKINKLKINGVITEDRKQWCEEIKTFYENLYGDSANLLSDQLLRLEALRASAADEPRIVIPPWIMEASRSAARSNRYTAAGSDGIQWNHLLMLPPRVVAHFRTLFEHRLNNREPCIIEEWCKILVTLVPKCKRAETLDQLRPISLTSCLQKWFASVVSHLLNIHSEPLSINCVGFVQSRQPMEVTETIRQLLQR